MAGQCLHKNSPMGRAGTGGERMQDEKIVGEREFGRRAGKKEEPRYGSQAQLHGRTRRVDREESGNKIKK